MFKIEFQDGKTVVLNAFSASQATILAAADRIRAGEVKIGIEHKVKSVRKLKRPTPTQKVDLETR